MKRKQISEGVFLNEISSDKFKTDYFEINFVLPLRSDTASLGALLPLVLKRGSANYPTMADITKRFDWLYSTGFSTRVIKRGENQIIGFVCDFLRENLLPDGEKLVEDVFFTVSNIIKNPILENGAFKAEYVASEKKNLIDNINSIINNKNAYAMKKCHEAMCSGSDYAVCELGEADRVKNITPEALYDFYKDLLSHARVEMFYTGNGNFAEAERLAGELFSDIERKEPYKLGTVKFERKNTSVTELTEEMEVAQGKIILGFSSGHTFSEKDYTAYSLFNELYGASPTSKLFDNVREKMSLCYYCRSIPDAHKGILTVASGIEVENRDRAVNEILHQLEETKNGNISEEELDSAKKSLINGYKELYDDGTSLPLWYLSRLIAGNTMTVDDVISEIEKVTKEDIISCAKATELDTVFFLKGTLKSGEAAE